MRNLFVKSYFNYPYDQGDHTYNRFWPPLSLINCASLVKQAGMEAEVLDAHLKRISPTKINNYTKGFDRIFITSSSLDRWQCPNLNINSFLQTVKAIKNDKIQIYILGYHGTVNPAKILELTQAKAIIKFEPELKVLDICKGKKLSEINGLVFKKGKNLISTPKGPLLDLRKLPIPDYGLVNFKKYHYELLGNKFSLFEFSRGCNYSCNFCNKAMYGNNFRQKNISQIIQELKTAIEKHKIETGYFIDLNFSADKEQVAKICDFLILKKYKFRWSCQTRIDCLEPDLIKSMKKAGCDLIHLGIETSNQNSLNQINKNIKVKQIKKTIKACRDFKVKTLGFYLFGLPGETKQDRIETLRFALEANTDFASFHRMIDYKNKYFFTKKVHDSQIDNFIRKAFCKYYLRADFILQKDILNLAKCFKLGWSRIKSLQRA